MKQKPTALSKLNDACVEAYRAHIPIIYIYTDDIELVRSLIAMDTMVERIVELDGGSKGFYRELPPHLNDRAPKNYSEGLSALPNPSKPDQSNGSLRQNKSDTPYIDVVLSNAAKINADGCPHIIIASAQELNHRVTPKYGENIAKLKSYVELYTNPYIPSEKSRLIRRNLLILYSKENLMPDFLKGYTEFVDAELPNEDEINTVTASINEDGALTNDFKGLSVSEMRRVMGKIVNLDDNDYANTDKVREKILSVKEQLIKGSSLLELINSRVSRDETGGLDNLCDYLETVRKTNLLPEDIKRSFGLTSPKGILICGIPGCGKSMAAKYTAECLGLPLLKMDIGMIMDKFVGQSEHRMKEALELAEAMSPCILFIDELDKAFSDAKSSRGGDDNGVFKRMFSRLLGWMQDNKKPCFVFATANDLQGLPPELFRSGRFERLYGMYLPDDKDCRSIFKAKLIDAEKRAVRGGAKLFKDDWHLNADSCREVMRYFADEKRILTGADIEKLVNNAVDLIAKSKMDSEKQISLEDMTAAIKECAEKTTVYGDNRDNLDQIALTYIKLFRLNFIPVSKQNLFISYAYDTETRDGNGLYLKENEKLIMGSAYNKMTTDIIRKRIEQIAPKYEAKLINDMLR